MEFAPETLDDSSLRTVRKLAEGGMGSVEIAVREAGTFRRLYAVKRLRNEVLDDESARTMFLDEARLAGLIRHPNVVSVLDVGVDRRGPYLVMDYVQGLSCGQLITWHRKSGREIPLQVCLRIAHQIALGLHAAHELRDETGRRLGLVHRDVSPQNVLIGFNGSVRLTDFGIAKAFGRTTKTTTGLLKGKVGYMAPEQLRFRDVDLRSDLFSFGVVFFELLTTRRLYREPEPSKTARRILDEPPPDLDDDREDAPPELVDLMFRLLAKEPETRPASAEEVAEVLEQMIADCVAVEGRLTLVGYLETHFADHAAKLAAELDELVTKLPEKEVPAQRAKRWPWAVAAAALLVVGGGAAWWATGDPEPTEPPALASSPELPESEPAVPDIVESGPPEVAEPTASTGAMEEPAAAPTMEPAVEPTPPATMRRATRRRRGMRSRMVDPNDRLFEWNP